MRSRLPLFMTRALARRIDFGMTSRAELLARKSLQKDSRGLRFVPSTPSTCRRAGPDSRFRDATVEPGLSGLGRSRVASVDHPADAREEECPPWQKEGLAKASSDHGCRRKLLGGLNKKSGVQDRPRWAGDFERGSLDDYSGEEVAAVTSQREVG